MILSRPDYTRTDDLSVSSESMLDSAIVLFLLTNGRVCVRGSSRRRTTHEWDLSAGVRIRGSVLS